MELEKYALEEQLKESQNMLASTQAKLKEVELIMKEKEEMWKQKEVERKPELKDQQQQTDPYFIQLNEPRIQSLTRSDKRWTQTPRSESASVTRTTPKTTTLDDLLEAELKKLPVKPHVLKLGGGIYQLGNHQLKLQTLNGIVGLRTGGNCPLDI